MSYLHVRCNAKVRVHTHRDQSSKSLVKPKNCLRPEHPHHAQERSNSILCKAELDGGIGNSGGTYESRYNDSEDGSCAKVCLVALHPRFLVWCRLLLWLCALLIFVFEGCCISMF